MLPADEVANYFIWLANTTGSFISNLKLQKLVYYAQAWYLAIHEKPLFEDDFEAWVHGPVIPRLYNDYRSFSWKPILKEVDETALASKIKEYRSFLEDVADEYFSCDAYELERMTHIEDPWIRARGNLPIDEPSNAIIRKEWMQEYYGARVQET